LFAGFDEICKLRVGQRLNGVCGLFRKIDRPLSDSVRSPEGRSEVGSNRGGSAVIKHYALRLTLWLSGYTPFQFIKFLDQCARLILLRKWAVATSSSTGCHSNTSPS
jgi:hypothetical protein